jgi:hypothetical protein
MKVVLHRGFAGVRAARIAMVAVLLTGSAVWAYPATSADALDRAAAAGSVAAAATDFLSVDQNAVVTFNHHGITYTNPPSDYSVRPSAVQDAIVGEQFPAVVVENAYIKATFVPGYGARMLSLIYKPTGHDLLYTNPVGVPDGTTNSPGSSPFYHNWLMVWGGVFPTFSEPEHGKYWFLPWDFTVSQTADAVSIKMTKTDDLDYAQKPSKFRYGATGIQATVTYTVPLTSPRVDMNVSLHNPGASSKQYEYWTCTTLSPGDGSTETSPTVSIVSPNTVIQPDPAYQWMAQVDAAAPGGGLQFNNLRKMTNWSDEGIAYGLGLNTNPQGNWWGVVNQGNGEGVVRVGDNQITPGMKLWEWGYPASVNVDLNDKSDPHRPYIEMWGGVSPRFFTPDTLAAGATKTWTESYLPTMGLADVTNANANGAAWVRATGSAVSADVFSTRVGSQVKAALLSSSGAVLAEQTFTADPTTPAHLTATTPAGSPVRLELTDPATGATLLTATATS